MFLCTVYKEYIKNNHVMLAFFHTEHGKIVMKNDMVRLDDEESFIREDYSNTGEFIAV